MKQESEISPFKNASLLGTMGLCLTLGVAVFFPDLSWAQNDSGSVNELLKNVSKNQLTALPYILSVVCYIGGAFMLLSGALKLKAYAENPANEKMAPGIARLCLGAVLLSIPAVTKVMQGSNQLGNDSASFASFSVNFQ